jgi:hypothetical protein
VPVGGKAQVGCFPHFTRVLGRGCPCPRDGLDLKQANASAAARHFGMANGAQAPAVLQPKG